MSSKKIVKIIPLGGLEQVGMNITAIRYGDDIIVIDCGLAFPSDFHALFQIFLGKVRLTAVHLTKRQKIIITESINHVRVLVIDILEFVAHHQGSRHIHVIQ